MSAFSAPSASMQKTPKGYSQVSTLDQGQQGGMQALMQMLMPLLQQSGGYYSKMLSDDPSAFAAFEAPYKRQFEEETVPGLAERFSSLGAGSQQSSAFQQTMGKAGAGLSENLASLRAGLQSSAAQMPLQSLLQSLGIGTQAYLEKPQQQMPFWQQLLTGLSGGLGQAAGAYGMSKFT